LESRWKTQPKYPILPRTVKDGSMNEKLKQALQELHGELNRIGPDNPKLQALQEKTARALEAGEHLPLLDDLKEASEEFEARHPQLTALINNVMNSLSSLGI
jgi:hypothetical protein